MDEASNEVERTPDEIAADRAADVVYLARASQTLPHHRIDVCAGDVVRWLREIADARARLPSPESVTRARLVAAEIVEAHVEAVRSGAGPLDDADEVGGYWRAVANEAGAHIRDRADTHVDAREADHADPATLLVLAQRVDRCTTLGELEGLVAQWREVA